MAITKPEIEKNKRYWLTVRNHIVTRLNEGVRRKGWRNIPIQPCKPVRFSLRLQIATVVEFFDTVSKEANVDFDCPPWLFSDPGFFQPVDPLAKDLIEHQLEDFLSAVPGSNLTVRSWNEYFHQWHRLYVVRVISWFDNILPTLSDILGHPVWDSTTRELSFRGTILKTYPRRSNQTLIIDEFQIKGWPTTMDDPLPYDAAVDSPERLQNTVKNLKKGIDPIVIEFGTRDGKTVFWKRGQKNL